MSDSAERLGFVDLWRSFAVVCMCVYHFIYDLVVFEVIPDGVITAPWMVAMQTFIGCSFVFISGICCRCSRSNTRRGLVVLTAGLVVTAVSYAAGNPIRFGVLQLLGVCMLLYAALGKRLEKLPQAVLPVACVVLFPLTKWLTDRVTVDITWLFPLGFVYPGFYSADYYPLLPWFFLFLLGSWMGGCLQGKRDGLTPHRALTWPGRHSLIIYLLHQPVLYGIVWLISRS